MPVRPTYPGVYVQEVPSGVRTITGVATSIAAFVGEADGGPYDKPIQCLSYSDFKREFTDGCVNSDMARYVQLFFANGGTECYVLRIADGLNNAEVTLLNESEEPALKLISKEPGLRGEYVRARVSYNGAHPEATFNLDLFRWDADGSGGYTQTEQESWKGLSMDPASPLYAPDFLTQESRLVSAELGAGAPPAGDGYSQSGRPIAYKGSSISTLRSALASLFGAASGAEGNEFDISVDGGQFVPVDLSAIDVEAIAVADFETDLTKAVADAIKAKLQAAGQAATTVSVTFEDGPAPTPGLPDDPDKTMLLRISSENKGNVFIRPSAGNDLAVPLMLGAEQGGIEVGAFEDLRPAANGITFGASSAGYYSEFAELEQGSITSVRLDGLVEQPDGSLASGVVEVPVDLATTGAADLMYRDGSGTSRTGNCDGVREKFELIRDAINNYRTEHSATFFWQAELWGQRLAIFSASSAGLESDNVIGSFATAGTDISTKMVSNVRYCSVGAGGASAGYQSSPSAPAADASPPKGTTYQKAYEILDREVDLFNLLILPPSHLRDSAEPIESLTNLWGPASVFCQSRRAFLLMDAPTDGWDTAQQASSGISKLRVGLVKDHAAIFFPRLIIREDKLEKAVGPAGAMAGLMARIDGSRGVWKAPAGTEADIRGIVGIEKAFSDAENGVMNPRGINTIRAFPNGIVSWGGRTMDGDDDFPSDWKYIPVRRLALFMEESLYRGLKWVVFEPNDEPLWAQIRLNVGAFMHDLYRKGAFQGTKPKDAYWVKCDSETTTQNDRNLGIVNIWVAFAPLKPAEFVILYLQQIAGQIQT
jgi:hypothetical protein